MLNQAIYPGTFDPITNGHLDLIERAAKIFQHIVIGVANNPTKKPLFNLDERVFLAEEATAHIENVSIVGFSGLLVDFAKDHQATILIRGVRSVSDFDYELQLANINRRLYPQLDSVFLPPTEGHSFISSTMVKEIFLHNGNISDFVPLRVSQALSAKRQAKL